jgi:hypothetical protein
MVYKLGRFECQGIMSVTKSGFKKRSWVLNVFFFFLKFVCVSGVGVGGRCCL